MNIRQLRYALAHGAQLWGYDLDEEQELPRRWLVAYFCHPEGTEPPAGHECELAGLVGTEPVQIRTVMAAILRRYITWDDVPGF